MGLACVAPLSAFGRVWLIDRPPPFPRGGVGLSAKPGQARESGVLRTVLFSPSAPGGGTGEKRKKGLGGRGLALSSGRAADLPFSVP